MPYVTCTKAIDDMPQYPGGPLIAFVPGKAEYVHESVRHFYAGNPDFAITEQEPALAAISEALGGLKFVKLTQASYDALPVKDSNTIYVIVG